MVRVWDLSGQFPLGVQRVQSQVVQRAEELAQARGAVQVAGQVRLALQDLDSAQVQGTEWEWVQETQRESELARGMVLDSEQGLVRDLARAVESVRE